MRQIIFIPLCLVFLMLYTLSELMAQKTMREMCLDLEGASRVGTILLDPNTTVTQRGWALIYDMYSKTATRCESCIPYLLASFVLLFLVAAYLTLFILARESRIIIGIVKDHLLERGKQRMSMFLRSVQRENDGGEELKTEGYKFLKEINKR